MKVTEAGVELDADFSVEAGPAGLKLTIESRGGARGAPNERNAQYDDGLRALLSRLGELGAVVTDALVTSSTSLRRYPAGEDRRLHVAGGYPIHAADHDPDELRRAFGRAMRKAARDPSLTSSGNNNKRVTFHLDVPGRPAPADLAAQLAAGAAVPAGPRRPSAGGRANGPSVPLVSDPGGRSRSQGYVADAAYRRAVELHAMRRAVEHYEDDWDVEDTSAGNPYDLKLTRGGRTRYVEVKGTAGTGDQINLTAGEVEHARCQPGQVVLFIVHGVAVDRTDPADPKASGGSTTIIDPFDVDAGDLKVTAFTWRPAANRAAGRGNR